VQQPDKIVQDHRHRLAGRLGIAVRNLHRDLFVLAQHHRRLVAAVVDQRIVQAAKACAGIERDMRKAVALDQVDDHIGLPAAIVRFRGLPSPTLFLHRGALAIIHAALCPSCKRGDEPRRSSSRTI
jgi:hypothetical protein